MAKKDAVPHHDIQCEECGWTGFDKDIPWDKNGDRACPSCNFIKVLV